MEMLRFHYYLSKPHTQDQSDEGVTQGPGHTTSRDKDGLCGAVMTPLRGAEHPLLIGALTVQTRLESWWSQKLRESRENSTLRTPSQHSSVSRKKGEVTAKTVGGWCQDGEELALSATFNSAVCWVTLDRPHPFHFPTQQNRVTARSTVMVITGAVRYGMEIISLCVTGLGSNASSAPHQLVTDALLPSCLSREMCRGRNTSFPRLQGRGEQTVSTMHLTEGPTHSKSPSTAVAVLEVFVPFGHLKVPRGDMKIASVSRHQMMLYSLLTLLFNSHYDWVAKLGCKAHHPWVPWV